ncbi:MAG: peptidoglycan editing factor PgeF [Candidatus Omnitrophica bacterium]|nr:peptidoglycan editing factor PgeF [Candidatus Omnitrophota bacterium]
MTSKTQNSPTSKALFNHFFPERVFTFVSESDVDFNLNSTGSPFNSLQDDYIKSNLGMNASDIANVKQVHGKEVVIIRDQTSKVVEADALIIDRRGLDLAVRTADCLPVFLFDEGTPAVGLVHAGWRGTKEQISAETVKLMVKTYNSKPKDIKVAFGPCIRAPRYEVGEEFLQHFPREVMKENQKYCFDLALANKNQLIDQGVLPDKIYDCGICTFDHQDYHSYRRDGQKAGRILSLIMLRD